MITELIAEARTGYESVNSEVAEYGAVGFVAIAPINSSPYLVKSYCRFRQ